MRKNNKRKTLVAVLLVSVMLLCSFPGVYAESIAEEISPEDMTGEMLEIPTEAAEPETGSVLIPEFVLPATQESDPETEPESVLSADGHEEEPEFAESPEEEPEKEPGPENENETFNDTESFEEIEFGGTVDIELKDSEISFNGNVTLVARVSGAEMEYRLVWEANDGDGRGWYEIAGGPEYSFILTRDNAEREYRVILYKVD